ncbi:methyltransferase domain-containing protein [Candidatus Dojkabacteria bacterium]|nr:methyltransferase domain-containing protein [Candidatus Dojkabacteria bacterium]
MKEKRPRLAVYDDNKYDYSTYWQGRQYEHRAEVLALTCLQAGKPKKGWFIDVGGSFGRLYDTYSEKYMNSVIVDYSVVALKQAKEQLGDKVSLIAANVYNLPFRNSTFQGGQMIRVLHHLDNQPAAVKELERIMSADSEFILEFANKRHLKNRIKAIRSKEFANRLNAPGPFVPESDGVTQGVKPGQKSIFLNYDLPFIKETLSHTKFIISAIRGVSILRSDFIKSHLPLWLMLIFERVFQYISSIFLWTPSVFLKLFKGTGDNYYEGSNIKEILVCPRCKGELEFKAESVQCLDCKQVYKLWDGVWDFRWPQN